MSKTKTFAVDFVNRQDVSLTSEIERFLDSVEDKLSALDQSIRHLKRVTATEWKLSTDDTEGYSSPMAVAPGSVKISTQDLEEVRRNNTIAHELHDILVSLDTAEAKLRSTFPEEGSAKGPLQHLQRLRVSTQEKLQEVATVLTNMAKGHAPQAFSKFVEQVQVIVSRSLVYTDTRSFIYLHEVDGAPVFSHYLMLTDCVDEDGTGFPVIYVVTSLKIGTLDAKTKMVTQPSEFFLTVLQQFEPPSVHLLTQKVQKVKDVVRSLHHLLLMDSFKNSLGSLPLPFTVKPQDVLKYAFNSAAYIQSVEIDDLSGNLMFHLKPVVQDSELIAKIAAQLQLDVKNLVARTRARLRVARKDWGDHWVLTFFLMRDNGAPPAMPEDLSFLKERFDLDDQKIKRVLQVVNSSTTIAKRICAGVDAAKEVDGKSADQEPNQPKQEVKREEPTEADKAATPEEMQEDNTRTEEVRDPRTPDTEGMTEKDVKFFAEGAHKPGSKLRQLLARTVSDNEDVIVGQIKKAELEWHNSGAAIASIARGNSLTPAYKQSLRTMASDLIKAILTLASKNDLPHGVFAMLSHRGPQDTYTALIEAATNSKVHAEDGKDEAESVADDARVNAQTEVVLKDALRILAEEFAQGEWTADEWAAAIKTSEHHTEFDGEPSEEAANEDEQAEGDEPSQEKATYFTKDEARAAYRRSKEKARIKDEDEYHWLKYTGKPLSLKFRGTPVPLGKGTRIGVRYSSNKKDKRLVIDAPGFGLTKVFTLTPELEQRLAPNVVKASSPARTTAGMSNADLKFEGARLLSLCKMASGIKNWDQESATKIQLDRARDPGMIFLRIKQNVASNLGDPGTHMGNGVRWYLDGDDATLELSLSLKDDVVTVLYSID